MTKSARKFPVYGILGLVVMIGTLAAVAYDHVHPLDVWWLHRISNFATPLCWWGYILFVDAWIYRIQGDSLLMTRRRVFWTQLPLSVVFWIIFEVYNFHLRNWHYEGVSPVKIERLIGMLIAFSTVLPAIFLTAEWIEAVGLFRRLRIARLRVTSRVVYTCFFLGLFSLILPLLVGREIAKYLFALVWVGFVFLLEPLNYSNGVPSLLGDLEKGSLTRIASLFLAGIVAGFFWESWNYWAATKWRYDAPFTPGIRIFEMPLAGFVGFGPFAWELYAMYHFARLLFRTSRGRPATPTRLEEATRATED